MTTDRPRVLIAEGGRGFSRGAVAAVRALAVAGYAPAVTVSGPSLAGASRYCAHRARVPSTLTDPDGFARAVAGELERVPYVAVLPSNDEALLALGAPVLELIDKVRLTERARAIGFPTPETTVFESAEALRSAAGSLTYPLVLKPDTKRYPAFRVDGAAELRRRLPRDEGRVIAQPYLHDALRGLLGLMHRGELVAAVHLRYLRIWPLPCGTASAAITVAADEVLEQRACRLLADHDGLFHMDLAGPYLLDLNPRLHATLSVAVASGANLAALYCDLRRGSPITPVRGRPGVLFRWLEGDLRSVFTLLRQGRMSSLDALGALRPRAHTVHGYESLSDPGPLLERGRYGAAKLIGRA